ncbi:MAG TPA: PadR family transcriptional regulator [Sphingomonas sp.]
MALITEQPRHGYDLIRAIEARTGGAYAPSPGVVYPTLTLLLDAGLAEEREAAGTRKLVAITDQGRALLVEREADVRVALARLDTLATITEKTDAAPIRRAMQNLKLALHNRLTDEGADKATLLDVAALIDEAASKIERL